MHAKDITRLVVLWALTMRVAQAAPVGAAFNYQGRLMDGSRPANGYYDLRFSLHSDPTNESQVGTTLTNDYVAVSNGLFALTLDFGAGLFDGTAYWLGVAVRTNDPTAPFTPLQPRQPLTAVPYSLYASSAGNAARAITAEHAAWNGLTGMPASLAGSGENVALLDAHQSFTGSNVFSGVNLLTNASNGFAGFFSGDGSGLSNLNVNLANLTGPITVQNVFSSSLSNEDGFARSVTVSGQYAYVADETNGLVVYNILNPAMPKRVGQINDGGNGWGVAVSGHYAYLANANDGLRIYDIFYPPAPINVGHVNNGSAARAIAVSGNYAYLANDADGLRIYDISDPSNPLNVGHANPGGLALGVAVAEGYVFLANDTNGLQVYSVADPRNPVPVAHFNEGGAAHGVAVVDRYAYLANGDDGLRIYDLGYFPTFLGPISPVGHVDEPGMSVGVTVDRNFAYLANASDGVRVYDLSSPTNPVIVRHVHEACCAYGVAVSGDAICVANGNDGLRLFAQMTNEQALRVELTGWVPNLIGGFNGNSVEAGAIGVTISGGGPNAVSMRSIYSSIGGGLGNTVGLQDLNPYGIPAEGAFSTIGGGAWNEISLFSPDDFSPRQGATIAGGISNNVSDAHSTIGGGYGNTVRAPASVIGGGEDNHIVRAFTFSPGFGHVIAGGVGNEINYENGFSTISGGSDNFVDGSDANIGGGSGNRIVWIGQNSANSIGGGRRNYIRAIDACHISGGADNFIEDSCFSAIGGGRSNQVTGTYSVVPGGFDNAAGGRYSLAAGRRARAKHDGSFVWADSTDEDFPSTGTNQFLIRASGGVGIGTTNPTGMLDVFDGSGPDGQGGSIHVGGTVKNGDPKLIYFGDMPNVAIGENGADDQLELRAGTFFFRATAGANGPGYVGIGTNAPVSALHVVGTITATSVSQSSDRAAKEHFARVDGRQVLEKVAQLPIESWNFKEDATRHLGPMAQDFYAAFGLGTDDKHIATVDADGVALAAVQGLNQKLEEALTRKEAEIQSLQLQLAELTELVHKLTLRAQTKSEGTQ